MQSVDRKTQERNIEEEVRRADREAQEVGRRDIQCEGFLRVWKTFSFLLG